MDIDHKWALPITPPLALFRGEIVHTTNWKGANSGELFRPSLEWKSAMWSAVALCLFGGDDSECVLWHGDFDDGPAWIVHQNHAMRSGFDAVGANASGPIAVCQAILELNHRGYRFPNSWGGFMRDNGYKV